MIESMAHFAFQLPRRLVLMQDQESVYNFYSQDIVLSLKVHSFKLDIKFEEAFIIEFEEAARKVHTALVLEKEKS